MTITHPLVGTVASGISGHLAAATGFWSIASYKTSGAGSTSYTFSAIPNIYKHLQLRISTQSGDSSSNLDPIRITLNGDSTSSYYYTELYAGPGGTFDNSRTNGTPISYLPCATAYPNGAPVNSLAIATIDFIDYNKTTKTKSVRSLYGVKDNSSTSTLNKIAVFNGVWNNTAAISSITLTTTSGTQFLNPTISLYGIS